MKERPILFSAPMVRAILEGRKTQTRRIVKPQHFREDHGEDASGQCISAGWYPDLRLCPYGQPGDRLWVRETFSGPWCMGDTPPSKWGRSSRIWYWADGIPCEGDWTRPRPSIHMPRWASRITLEITDVRVQRLHEISEEDAIAEGVHPAQGMRGEDDLMVHQVVSAHEGLAGGLGTFPFPKARFVLLWDSINGKYPNNWNANPWVWAIEFKRVEAAR